MKTLIFAVMMCVMMAVNAGAGVKYHCVNVNTGKEIPCSEEIIKQCGGYDFCASGDINMRRIKHSPFYKVIGEDIRLRANEIEAWKIEKGYIKKDVPLEQCEARGFYKEWTVCVPTTQAQGDWLCNYMCAERKWTIQAKYEGCWHDIKVFKTRQQAKDWLDRQAP